MYNYHYDEQTGGILLEDNISEFSKEPRPVYSSELDLFGFDKYWDYPKDDTRPIMWAESSNYVYRGKIVAKVKGGSLYNKPELIITHEGEGISELTPVDVESMVEKNRSTLESLVNNTVKRVYNTYSKYKSKVDIFYVAFSGGKDSIVALDIVQRAIPHSDFVVIFGDTMMEYPDTYETVNKIQSECENNEIRFFIAKHQNDPNETWVQFGPPGNMIRWCCTVHKSVPQMEKLREITGKVDFSSFAFTGVRGDESLSRSGYDFLNIGAKANGQYSYHAILNWGSAELYIYLFERGIDIPVSYKKGNSRVGCLMCPMSPPKHDYVKNKLYPKDMGKFIDLIKKTSRIQFDEELPIENAIDTGSWKKRRSGAGLLSTIDCHKTIIEDGKTTFLVFKTISNDWKEWMKTLGTVMNIDERHYIINYKGKEHEIVYDETNDGCSFTIMGNRAKHELEFISYFRSIVIKTVYCVKCGACAVNCPDGQISMKPNLVVGDHCKHCLKCHEMHGRCVRYNSIKNTLAEGKSVKGIDRYATFGFKKSWVSSYFKYMDDFWDNNSELGTKMLDSFCKFLDDSGLAVSKREAGSDKWSRYKATDLTKILSSVGVDSEETWGIILINLAYTPQINWYINNISPNENYSADRLYEMLENVMEGDPKGKGKRNVISSLKNILIYTPIGDSLGLGICDYVEKTNGITLNSVRRDSWENPDPLAILYGMYKYSEYAKTYQYNLSEMYDNPDMALSPNNIFNIPLNRFRNVISGLSVNYPEFISSSFTLDLETIDLNKDKKAEDVLKLIG